MKGSNPLSVVEADLRLLSGESRKSESLTGQLTGWLSGPEHPQLREAVERALLKLLQGLKHRQELNEVCMAQIGKHLLMPAGCLEAIPGSMQHQVAQARQHLSDQHSKAPR